MVSEFGMHGFPDIRTVKAFAPDEKSHYPNSRMIDTHNKSRGSENRMGRYLWENFRMPTTMESFIYLSQLLQAEALDHAVIGWRREFKGEGEELNMGSIIWQLNDSNPTTSWSLVDYYFRPKAAFYTTRRAFAAVTVGMSRTPVWHYLDERDPFPTNIPTFEIWGSNFHMKEQEIELRLQMYDLTSRKEISLGSDAKQKFTLRPNCSTELRTLKSPPDIKEDSYVILAASLHDMQTGDEIARKVSWPEPYRYLDLPEDTSIKVNIVDEETVELECAEFPAKGVLAYVDPADGEEPEWEDNMHDLMPGEKMRLGVKGLQGRKVRVRHLGSIY
jgi:beta-mannosidase